MVFVYLENNAKYLLKWQGTVHFIMNNACADLCTNIILSYNPVKIVEWRSCRVGGRGVGWFVSHNTE